MKTLEQQVQELADREELKELTAHYAHGVARGEGAKVAALFADDGVFINDLPDTAPTVVRGREALDKFYGAIKRNTALPCIHNHLITLAGDEAKGTCSIEVRITRNNQSMIGSGYYKIASAERTDAGSLSSATAPSSISCRCSKDGRKELQRRQVKVNHKR